jgi:hypothetical protein
MIEVFTLGRGLSVPQRLTGISFPKVTGLQVVGKVVF